MKTTTILIKLNNPIASLSFSEQQINDYFTNKKSNNLKIIYTDKTKDFLDNLAIADYILTWVFKEEFYDILRQKDYKLKAILTPAAGHDWVKHDPNGEITVVHGTFHGQMMAESLLSMMLYSNSKLDEDIESQKNSDWGHHKNKKRRLLRNQKAAIIGYGKIGSEFSKILRSIGMNVIAFKRNPNNKTANDPTKIYSMDQLSSYISDINHLILILPGEAKGTITLKILKGLPDGASLYNFGRGGTISDSDIISALNKQYINFAGLDVVEQEPLPKESKIWSHPKILLTPHSSCGYVEYISLFLDQVTDYLNKNN